MDTRPAAAATRLLSPLRMLLVLMTLASTLFLAGCGGESSGEERGNAAPAAAGSVSAGGDLTPDQMEHGIGPIRNMELGPVDPALVSRGEEVFQLKCSACHKLDDRYVGPPLRDVTERRTPEFIMNMLLNSWEMTQRHPTVRGLLAEYYTPMPDQDLSEEDARAVLDYLRHVREDDAGS
jgi:cytochrome c